MSQLELHGRPWTVFDPASQQHRAWYYDFVKTGTWGRCQYGLWCQKTMAT